MEAETLKNPTIIAAQYKDVIGAFKKRSDVFSGHGLGYRKGQDPNGELTFENTPKGIGDGLATTGWCVSASQALFYDPIFNILLKDRGAMAKLISIDIKEQHYGKTYSGNQNKWHTAILVKDSNYNLVIDLTCAQFGNNFVGKDIWDFETWEKTFRSPLDKHTITDFENNIISYLPKASNISTSGRKDSIAVDVIHALHDITTITDFERKILADFFIDKIDIINTKLVLGNINKIDYRYLDDVNKLLKNLDFIKCSNQYFVMRFVSKDIAKHWISKFLMNDGINNQFLCVSNSIEDSCKNFGFDCDEINKETNNDTTYVVFEFTDIKGFDIGFLNNCNMLIPYGIKLEIDLEKDVFNGGKLLNDNMLGIEKKTNTIYIRATN